MLPCGRPFFENTRLVVFVCVALRAASILKNHVFGYLTNVPQVNAIEGYRNTLCLNHMDMAKESILYDDGYF